MICTYICLYVCVRMYVAYKEDNSNGFQLHTTETNKKKQNKTK